MTFLGGATRIPEVLRDRLGATDEPSKQKTTAVKIALETIGQLQKIKGLRGFSILADDDPEMAQQILDESGLRGD